MCLEDSRAEQPVSFTLGCTETPKHSAVTRRKTKAIMVYRSRTSSANIFLFISLLFAKKIASPSKIQLVNMFGKDNF